MRAQSHACVGVYHTASLDFPGEIARYCPLSFTEAKLFLPQLLQELEDAGYGDLPVPINITGCPNSCAFSAIGGIGLWGALKRQADGHEYFDIADRWRHGWDDAASCLARFASVYAMITSAQPSRACSTSIDVNGWSGESFSDFCYRLGADDLQQRVPAR